MIEWYLENGKLSRYCANEQEKLEMHIRNAMNTVMGEYPWHEWDYGVDFDTELVGESSAIARLKLTNRLKRLLKDYTIEQIQFVQNGPTLQVEVTVNSGGNKIVVLGNTGTRSNLLR